ncbi:MAG TPA: methyltransferase [Xanthobacteraceae bacterium]|nr:methyltransferase [Xanthobacteraceae bacterium]
MSGIYGLPPAELAPWPEDATQFSPLIPGSQSLETAAEGSLAAMTMAAPPGTLERRYAIGLMLRALAPDAPFTVLAPKNRGGSRLAAELEELGCSVTEASKRHFRICAGRRPEVIANLDQVLQAGAPRLLESLGLWSQPGVFSWDRLDPGSSLLADHLPALAGRGADLGCGIGYLARRVLASPKVEHLTLIDVDGRALAMAKLNVDPQRTSFVWADVRRQETTLRGLDFVVMNPPFHATGTEDRTLGKAFIARAAESLRRDGTLWLTANRHLPYEETLSSLFGEASLKAEGQGFKIYMASK